MEKTKTTKEDFEYFKECCKKWIDLFELNNWEVHFDHKEDKEARGSIARNLAGYIATIFLAKEWDNTICSITKETLDQVALHEVIHLLLGRIYGVAGARFVSSEELSEAEEETIRKIEHVISKLINNAGRDKDTGTTNL